MFAIDTETSGLKWYANDKPFLFAGYNGTEYIIETIPDRIKQICEDPTIPKLFHNAKFDILMLKTVGVTVRGQIIDTMIASFLLNENRTSNALKALAREILGETTDEETAVNDWFKASKIKMEDRKYNLLPTAIITPYAKKDVLYTWNLWQKFEPEIKEQGLEKLFQNECDLIYVLADMETRGIRIDLEKTKGLQLLLSEQIKEIETDIRAVYGSDFNFESTKQLGEKLKEEGNAVEYTDKGNIITDADTLETYTSELAKKVVAYRKADKMRTTYCDGFLRLADSKGIIHPNFKQTGAKTGRFSCTDPNLQNVKKPEDNNPESKLIRGLFIPREGYTNFYFDYDQIEYRLAAYYINDEDLIQKINDGEDVHTIQTQRIFRKEEVTKAERAVGKTINFAVLYGAGVDKIATSLGKSRTEAERILEIFYKENPGIQRIKKGMKQRLVECGYITNTFGRRRHLEIEDHYKGFNSLCQGLAADIIKFAMVRVHKLLQGTKSSILLNVHDELAIEIFHGEEHLVPLIKAAMEDFPEFTVKISVGVDYSDTNWAEKKEYTKC